MKKNAVYFIILLVISSLSLTSCTSNSSWLTGFFDCFFYPTSNSRGVFVDRGIFTTQDITGVNLSRENIRAIEFRGTSFILEGGVMAGDVISNLTIDINRLGEYRFPPVLIRRNGESIIFDTRNDPNFANYMAAAMQQLVSTNQLDIIVSGNIVDRGGFPVNNAEIDLALKTTLDINVSDF